MTLHDALTNGSSHLSYADSFTYTPGAVEDAVADPYDVMPSTAQRPFAWRMRRGPPESPL